METKICTKCGKEKLLEEFYFRNKELNKRRSDCKICCEVNRNSKEHYEKYKDEYKLRNKNRKKRLVNENVNQLLTYLETHHCVDCGESNPIVMEFDHLDPTRKLFSISTMMHDYTWEQIMVEIKKCEVVCANCHKIRTSKQFGWLKFNRLTNK